MLFSVKFSFYMMKYRKEGIGLGLSERGDYTLWQTSEEEIVKAVKVFVMY